MSYEPYPNDEDLRELAEAQELMRRLNVVTGPRGYDLDTLAALAYAHGWGYRIDRATGMMGYRVELRPQSGAAQQPVVSAVGWEPEVALVFALARALRQHPEMPGQPSDAPNDVEETVGSK